MNKLLKKSLAISLILVLILIIIFLIPGSKVTLNIFSIIIILALLVLVWVKHFQEIAQTQKDGLPRVKKTPSNESEAITKTGSVCEQSGVYVCQEHAQRTVEMEEGKRFPPCRGDEKGHSAIWLLQK